MRIKGRIQFVRERFGFISCPSVDGDVFFHVKSIVRGEAKVGRECEFELGETSRGPIAIDVVIFGSSLEAGAMSALGGDE